MGRIALGAVATTIGLYSAWFALWTPAQAQTLEVIEPSGFVRCYLPPWYPRGWELMIRPCAPYYYSVPYRAHRVHRRPYLRPGWWW
jgi:hypothetical protein